MTHDEFIERADSEYGELSEREYLISRASYLAGVEHKPQTKAVAVKKPKKVEIDDAFNEYWSAGMRKMDKKKSRAAFERAIPADYSPEGFAIMLREDVADRLRVGQVGFDAMHPTTYLNNERWEDEVKAPQEVQQVGGMGKDARQLFGLEPAEEQTGFVFDHLEGPADDGMALLLQASRARLEG